MRKNKKPNCSLCSELSRKQWLPNIEEEAEMLRRPILEPQMCRARLRLRLEQED